MKKLSFWGNRRSSSNEESHYSEDPSMEKARRISQDDKNTLFCRTPRN